MGIFTADKRRLTSYKNEIGGSFGRRLRETRLERGLSVVALARAAGVGRTLILLAEAGSGGGAAIAAVAALADVLKVSRGWLAYGDDVDYR